MLHGTEDMTWLLGLAGAGTFTVGDTHHVVNRPSPQFRHDADFMSWQFALTPVTCGNQAAVQMV